MKWIFTGMIAFSVLCGVLFGRMDAVTNAAISDCSKAVELTLALTGSLCMWSGLMKVAERSRLTEKISRLLAPLVRLLFTGISSSGRAAQAITLNISANLLGLGNAATPLGLMAMREMQRESGSGDVATDDMAMFVVLNTACLQLIPTTTALLRANAGSAAPLEIMPASWAASAISVVFGVLAAKILSVLGRSRK